MKHVITSILLFIFMCFQAIGADSNHCIERTLSKNQKVSWCGASAESPFSKLKTFVFKDGSEWFQSLSEDTLRWNSNPEDSVFFSTEGAGVVWIQKSSALLFESSWTQEGDGPLKLDQLSQIECNPGCKLQILKPLPLGCRLWASVIDRDPKGLNVRAAPNAKAGTSTALMYDQWVLVEKVQGQWAKITYPYPGWVFAARINTVLGSGKKSSISSNCKF